jgi:hypothetical protein
LYNVELNARRHVSEWLQILAGFRHVQLNEQGVTILQDIGPGLNLATIGNGASNHLWGFQLGVDGVLWTRNRLSVESVCKAGIFGNSAQNQVSITQSAFPGTGFTSSDETGHTAFVGEVGLTGVYRLTDCLSVRSAYQLMWLEGVAVASDQIAVSDPLLGNATVDTGGSLFYHGAFIGLQLEL